MSLGLLHSLTAIGSSSSKRRASFPTNFQSIGYIEFESDDLTARPADLLKELIGFGSVKVTPTQ
jgi:hypothetical protein